VKNIWLTFLRHSVEYVGDSGVQPSPVTEQRTSSSSVYKTSQSTFCQRCIHMHSYDEK